MAAKDAGPYPFWMKGMILLLLLGAPVRAERGALLEPAPSTGPVITVDTTPARGTVQSVRARLEAQDPQGALEDAKRALARDGKAEDWAALGDAELALGRLDAAVADYTRAGALDPRYLPRRDGLAIQKASEAKSHGSPRGEIPVKTYAAAAFLLLFFLGLAVAAFRRRGGPRGGDGALDAGKR